MQTLAFVRARFAQALVKRSQMRDPAFGAIATTSAGDLTAAQGAIGSAHGLTYVQAAQAQSDTRQAFLVLLIFLAVMEFGFQMIVVLIAGLILIALFGAPFWVLATVTYGLSIYMAWFRVFPTLLDLKERVKVYETGQRLTFGEKVSSAGQFAAGYVLNLTSLTIVLFLVSKIFDADFVFAGMNLTERFVLNAQNLVMTLISAFLLNLLGLFFGNRVGVADSADRRGAYRTV